MGTFGSHAEELNKFLKHNSCDRLLLAGDVVDFWALSRHSYFPPSHVKVLRRFLKQKEVIYILGNHDEVLRKFLPLSLGNIILCNEFIHETRDGKRYLVIHGDGFDSIIQCAPWLAWIGDIGYTVLLQINRWLNYVRKLCRLPYWSLSATVKARVKSAVNYIGNYEIAISHAAAARQVDGVICGHIHHAEIRDFDNIRYINTGDWVESMTAIVENFDGSLDLLRWQDTAPAFAPAEHDGYDPSVTI